MPGNSNVVAVQIGHDIAVDVGEADIDGVRLALVRLAAPTDAIAPTLQEFERAVDGGAVLHVIVQVRVVLTKDAVDRGAQISGLIEARRDDRDPGHVARQRGWRRNRGHIERARRMLFERPHRGTQQRFPENTSPMRVREKLLIPLEERQAIGHFVQSVSNLLLKFVIHH